MSNYSDPQYKAGYEAGYMAGRRHDITAQTDHAAPEKPKPDDELIAEIRHLVTDYDQAHIGNVIPRVKDLLERYSA